jgi:alkylated DNA repair protein alkB family protein 1
MYFKYQKMSDAAVDDDVQVVDFKRGLTDAQKERIILIDTLPSDVIAKAQKAFGGMGEKDLFRDGETFESPAPCTVYEHQDFPGNLKLPKL